MRAKWIGSGASVAVSTPVGVHNANASTRTASVAAAATVGVGAAGSVAKDSSVGSAATAAVHSSLDFVRSVAVSSLTTAAITANSAVASIHDVAGLTTAAADAAAVAEQTAAVAAVGAVSPNGVLAWALDPEPTEGQHVYNFVTGQIELVVVAYIAPAIPGSVSVLTTVGAANVAPTLRTVDGASVHTVGVHIVAAFVEFKVLTTVGAHVSPGAVKDSGGSYEVSVAVLVTGGVHAGMYLLPITSIPTTVIVSRVAVGSMQ